MCEKYLKSEKYEAGCSLGHQGTGVPGPLGGTGGTGSTGYRDGAPLLHQATKKHCNHEHNLHPSLYN